MLTVVLGAPGSGKTTIAPLLRRELNGWAVVDWDQFMPPVAALTGRDVRTSPELWEPYRRLVVAVVEALANLPVVVFGVATPDEVPEWADARWLVLDCDGPERRRRLASRVADEIEAAVADAARYRTLGVDTVDTTGRTVDEVVREVAAAIRH